MFLWLLLDSQQQYLFHEPRTEWKEWETTHPWLICLAHQVMVITTQYNILDSDDSKKSVQVMMASSFYSSCKVFNTLQASLHFFYHSTHTYIWRNTPYRHPLSFFLSSTNGRIHFIVLGLDLGPPDISFLLSAFFPFHSPLVSSFSSFIVLHNKGQKITVCLSMLLLLDFWSFESLKIGFSHKIIDFLSWCRDFLQRQDGWQVNALAHGFGGFDTNDRTHNSQSAHQRNQG